MKSPDGPFTISDLADKAGVPVSTVRYYERRGLLPPDDRTESNYRLYGDHSLERLRFIRSAQQAGFTLSNIATLLEFRDGDLSPCGEVRTLIEKRLEEVAQEMEHLASIQTDLKRWLKVCKDADRTGRCGVLQHLGEQSEHRNH